jgi:hypothetical protein
LSARADWARSGLVLLTGRHAGPPLVPPGGAATAARDLAASFRTLAAGLGRTVDLDGRLLLGERAALLGLRRHGPWSAGRACRAVQTADGWCALTLVRPTDFASVPALVEHEVAGQEVDSWRAVARWARDGTSEEVAGRAQLLGLAAGPIPQPPVPPPAPVSPPEKGSPLDRRAPLVVDLSALWAGPLASHLLGLAGARVIKVETPDRLDGARRGSAEFYRLLHGGHESVVLDLTTTKGRADFRSLLVRADIVVDSSRPRAMERLGIDPETICSEGRTTWVSITAYGREGPRSNWVGFGDDVAMAAGLVAYDDSAGSEAVPLPCGDALADPLAGLEAAVAALASYFDGGGRLLEISMHRAAARTRALGDAVALPARRSGRGWVLEADEGLIPVAPPVARRPAGAVASPGADTRRVLRQWSR